LGGDDIAKTDFQGLQFRITARQAQKPRAGPRFGLSMVTDRNRTPQCANEHGRSCWLWRAPSLLMTNLRKSSLPRP